MNVCSCAQCAERQAAVIGSEHGETGDAWSLTAVEPKEEGRYKWDLLEDNSKYDGLM